MKLLERVRQINERLEKSLKDRESIRFHFACRPPEGLPWWDNPWIEYHGGAVKPPCGMDWRPGLKRKLHPSVTILLNGLDHWPDYKAAGV